MSFSERLKKSRTDRAFSQGELAKRVGVHYTQIGRYENKGAQPSADILAKLASALGVSVDFLMGGSLEDQAQDTLSDRDLLRQFQRLEELPSEQKFIVKELIDAFLLKSELQQKLAH